MTSIADQNDKWASYAQPGSWNGRIPEFLSQQKYFSILNEYGYIGGRWGRRRRRMKVAELVLCANYFIS